MDQKQQFILLMAQQALDVWADGSEPLMFPVSCKTDENPGNRLWFGIINAMAYGFEHGMSRGYQMATEELRELEENHE